MMPETCWDESLIINIRLVASCRFLSLHPTFITTFSNTCPYPESARSSPCPHIPLLEDPSLYNPPIYAWVFQVVCFHQSCTKSCYRPLPWASWNQPTTYRLGSWSSILVLPFRWLHLGLPSDRFDQGFLPKYCVHLSDAISIPRPSNPPITLM